MQSHQEVQGTPNSILSSNVQNIYQTSQKAHRALHSFALATGELVDAIWDIDIKDKVNKSISLYKKEKSFDLDKALDALNRASWVNAIRELDILQFRKDRLFKIYNDEDMKIPYFWFEGPECLQRLQSDDEEVAEIEEMLKKYLLNPCYKSGKNQYERVEKTLAAVQEKTRFFLFRDNPVTQGVTHLDDFQWLEHLERLLHKKAGVTNLQAPLADLVKERGNKAPMTVERAAVTFQIFKNGNVEVKIKPNFLAALNGTKPALNDPRSELHRLLTQEFPAELADGLTCNGQDADKLHYTFMVQNVEGSVWSYENFAYIKLGKELGVKAHGTAADRFRGICDFLRPSPAVVVPESIDEESTRADSGIGIIAPPSKAQDYALLLREFLAQMPATPTLDKSTLSGKVKEINALSTDLLNSLLAGNLDNEAARFLVIRTRSLRADVGQKRTAANENAITCALIECQSIEALGQAIEEIMTEIKAD